MGDWGIFWFSMTSTQLKEFRKTVKDEETLKKIDARIEELEKEENK